MLNMAEKTLLVLGVSFAVALTASLIRASWTYEVKLVGSPRGPVIFAPLGEPLNVSCQGLGGYENKFSFMKWVDTKENTIEEGIPGVVKGENNSLFLTFIDPKTEDSGIYRCKALYDNQHNLEYAANIVFHGPEPEFEPDFENVTVVEGDNVEIYCSAVGEKPMTYKWYNQTSDEIPEIEGRPIFASSSEDGSRLIFQSVKLWNRGMYTCNAKNSHGLSSKLYYLDVLTSNGNDTGNDTSTHEAVEVVSLSANSVQFRIVGYRFASNRSVRYIAVRYWESRNNTEYVEQFAVDPTNLYTITDLIPSGSYSFQFSVLPSENNDTWSKVYQVTLRPGVPEIIFHNLEKGSIKLEMYRTIEDILRKTIDKYEIKYYLVRIQGGNSWVPSTCEITIQIPVCASSKYTISGLGQNVFYQLEVRAHTSSGYGEPAKHKIYLSG